MKERFIKKAAIEAAELEDYLDAVDRLLEIFLPKEPGIWAVVLPLQLGREAYQTIYWTFFPEYDLEEKRMKALDDWFVLDEDLGEWDGRYSEIFYYLKEPDRRSEGKPMILHELMGEVVGWDLEYYQEEGY